MEISASEIDVLCRQINSAIGGYSVSGIYSIESGMLLRLRHETRPELLIAASSFAAWLTTKNISLSQADRFVSRIRETIERTRLLTVARAGNERIAQFSFESRSGEKYAVYTEFFGGGNIVLVDAEGAILDALKTQRFRHRSISVGEKYLLPPPRGTIPEQLSANSLSSLLKDSLAAKDSSKMDAVRWFGRNVATSRKLVEEVFFRSGVEPDSPIASISREHLEALARATQELFSEVRSSSKGYLIRPKEDAEENDEVDVDVCPILTNGWKLLSERAMASITEFASFNEALDEAQVEALVLQKRRSVSKETRSKAAELDSAITKQEALLERNKKHAEELREMATTLMSSGGFDEATTSRLEALDVVAKDDASGGRLRFLSEPKSFVSAFQTARALGSRLFDEAKKLEENNRTIADSREGLVKRRDALMQQTELTEERAEKRIALERRARQWFERYRWFLTSDMRLAVGGRDSTSNSIMINKYTKQEDLVFHADLHGSPFFILKSGAKEELSQPIELEMAQATVSFSRAWKDELGSADAFWVRPDQVKKSAPSGEYLPRGSFFIEGKKNFVKHAKVELSIGLMTSEKLLAATRAAWSEEGEPESGGAENQPVVVCGPEKSLSEYCTSRVKIAPGREKSTMIARRIKQLLVERLTDREMKEMAKKIPIDEVIRVLPAGAYKIVSEKQDR